MFPLIAVVVMAAAAADGTVSAPAERLRGSSGERWAANGPVYGTWAFATTEEFEFSAPPMYEPGPGSGGPGAGARQEPLLVPLPPGVWAAMSGLVGLAMVAAWRKHRFREG